MLFRLLKEKAVSPRTIAVSVALACAGLAVVGYGGWRGYNQWWWNRYGALDTCALIHVNRARNTLFRHDMDCLPRTKIEDEDYFVTFSGTQPRQSSRTLAQ